MEKAIDFRILSADLAIALTGLIHVWESDQAASSCDFDVRKAASKRSSLLAFPKEGKVSWLVPVAETGVATWRPQKQQKSQADQQEENQESR
jgi:hypothetical protein